MVDIVQRRIMLADAEDYRQRATRRDVRFQLLQMRLREREDLSELNEYGKWVQGNILEGNDQIAALIKAAGSKSDSSGRDHVSYQRARSWGPVVRMITTTIGVDTDDRRPNSSSQAVLRSHE